MECFKSLPTSVLKDQIVVIGQQIDHLVRLGGDEEFIASLEEKRDAMRHELETRGA